MSLICDKLKELATIPFKSKEDAKAESNVVQKQSAGDGSVQVQANNINYIVGIDENRAREISREVFENLKGVAVAEAIAIAKERVKEFEDNLFPRISSVEGALNEFCKPEFQYALGKAQKVAAQTEREVDYELLTELLVCKIEKGKERKVDASLNHAVDIVNEVDDDALCALTVAHSIGAFYPANGDILKGIEKYDELYATLLCYELPKDDIWLEHLETLNLVRISNFGRMLKFEEILYNGLDGYVCVGIRKDSEEFLKASNILKCVGFSDELLVDHSLLEGYVRLPFVRRSTIKNLRFVDGRLINVDEIQALNDVWDLYSKDAALVNQVKKDFISEIEKNRNLKIVKEWWNKIALNFHIKQSGKVLAHVNAKRLNEKVPDLI